MCDRAFRLSAELELPAADLVDAFYKLGQYYTAMARYIESGEIDENPDYILLSGQSVLAPADNGERQ